MNRIMWWRHCLAIFGFWLIPQFWLGELFCQTGNDATVEGILPAGPYSPGQSIKIYGIEIYDIIAGNCDQMIFDPPVGPNLVFNGPVTPSPGDYTGINGNTTDLGLTFPPYPAGTRDTVFWTIPCDWVAGSYSVFFFDDEDCNGGGNSNSLNFTITNALPVFEYPGTNIYCLGSSSQAPINAMPTGTYVDLSATGPGNSVISNSSSGTINIHSGAATLPFHEIEYTSSFGCSLIDTVIIRAIARDTLDYVDSTFCKSTAGASLVSAMPVVGTYSILPSFPGAINASSGDLTFNALPAGSYQVSFNATNPDDCFVAPPYLLTLTELDSAVFDYPAEFCAGDASGGWPTSIDYKPNTGGFFCLDPNCIVDDTTGRVDLVNSLPGTYEIFYDPLSSTGCAVVKADSIVIRAPLPVSFSLQSVVCSDIGLITPSSVVTSGGQFSILSGNFVLNNATTGEIDVNASTPGGPYYLTLTNGDPTCPDTAVRPLSIVQRDTAAVEYPNMIYCSNGNPVSPFFTLGSAGGTFFCPTIGLLLDDSLGTITLQGSNPGTYDIYYSTPAGTCADTILVVDNFKMVTAPDASFGLATYAICKSNTNYPIDTLPSQIGTFTVYTSGGTQMVGGMSGNSIATNALPDGGPFLLAHVVQDSGCVDSASTFFYLNQFEDAGFYYEPDTFCKADQDPIGLITGDGGGTFFVDSLGGILLGDANTGRIDLSETDQGYHTIYYQTNGPCPAMDSFEIYILDATLALFNYPTQELCFGTMDSLVVTNNGSLPLGVTFEIYQIINGVFSQNATVTNALNPNNGTININALGAALDTIPSEADSFRVVMFLASQVGACVDSFYRDIEVFVSDSNSLTLTFDVPSGVYCLNDSFAQVQLLLNGVPTSPNPGTLPGNFFSNPPFLAWANRDSGLIAVNRSLPQEYEIYFVRSNSCRDIASDSLRIESPEVNTLTYADSFYTNIGYQGNFCYGDTVPAIAELLNFRPGVFTFLAIGGNGTVVFTDSTLGHIDLTQTNAGSYVITFTGSAGCTNSASTPIDIYPGPINPGINMKPSDTVCAGDTIFLEVAGSPGVYLMANGDTISEFKFATYVTQQSQLNVVFDAYLFDDYGCFTTLTTTPLINPIPVALPIVPTTSFSTAAPIAFDVGTTAPQTSFNWAATGNGAVSGFSLSQDSIFSIDPGGLLTIMTDVQLYDTVFSPGEAIFQITPYAAGCEGDPVEVSILVTPPELYIYVPEVFTPNGDGWNENWEIHWNPTINPQDYEIFIYNRSGGMVKYLEELTNDWNGGNLPDGVYWYDIRNRNTGNSEFKGGLTIRRR